MEAMKKKSDLRRQQQEILHSQKAAEGAWGWASDWGFGTPAGKLRAIRRAELILSSTGLTLGKRVLELGCGSGTFSKIFAESGISLTALDLSPDMVALARRNLVSTKVTVLQESFEDYEPSEPLDGVIGSSILHHLELERTLKKIYRILNPGGIMSFAEPNMLNPQVYLERRFRKFFSHISPDETAYYRGDLRKALLRTGFKISQITPFDWLHPATPEALIPFVSSLGLVIEKIPLLREFAGSLLIRARKVSS